jgi:hypothetical protein
LHNAAIHGLPIAVATIAGASEVDHALIGVEASRQNGGCGANAARSAPMRLDRAMRFGAGPSQRPMG